MSGWSDFFVVCRNAGIGRYIPAITLISKGGTKNQIRETSIKFPRIEWAQGSRYHVAK